jgi:septum formation protein
MPADTSAPIILASSSPRRRELLLRLGIPFVVRPTGVDEEALEATFTGPPEELGPYLARHKAEAALGTADAATPAILAADTTVILDGQVLGKPRDADEAWLMLRRLRGRTHMVTTGVVLALPNKSSLQTRSVSTLVTMREFGDEEIAAYIATGDPFDKAGSYAIQHADFQPVARFDGCVTNVIGLPLCSVATLLREAGIIATNLRAAAERCPWDTRCTL